MAKFKVGDIVTIIKCYNNPEYLGRECTITSELKEFKDFNGTWMGYELDFKHNGKIKAAQDHQLKLKRPDGEQSIFSLFDSLDDSLVKDEVLETVLRNKIKEGV